MNDWRFAFVQLHSPDYSNYFQIYYARSDAGIHEQLVPNVHDLVDALIDGYKDFMNMAILMVK